MTWNTNLRLLAKQDPPTFHMKKLSLAGWWSEPLFFSAERQIVKDITIDLSKVIGLDQGYPQMTWGYMLNSLKRIDRNLMELKNNPDFYLDSLRSDVTYTDIDGNFFISQGKHRTTIAKYLTHFNPDKFPNGPLLHGVDLIRYEVNHVLIDQVQLLRMKLKNESFDHLELSWLGANYPFYPPRFRLTNTLRPNRLPLFFNEDQITRLIDVFDRSGSFASAYGSEEANYLRKPFLKLFTK